MNYRPFRAWLSVKSPRIVAIGGISCRLLCVSDAGHQIGRDRLGLLRVALATGEPLRRQANNAQSRPVAWFKRLLSAQRAAELE